MKIESLAAAALFVVAGGVGCSSEPGPVGPQLGLKSSGVAQLTIDGAETGRIEAVQCTPAAHTTSIVIGTEPPVAAATISNDDGLAVKWVRLRDSNGFTGSYNEGLGGEAHVELAGSTYQISGIAGGFDKRDARQRVTAKFTIEVSC
jgi:ipoprotein LpqH